MELVAAPVEGLELSYDLGILSAHYVSLAPNPALNLPSQVQITLGSKLAKDAANENLLGADYHIQNLIPGGAVTLHADWRFTSHTFTMRRTRSICISRPTRSAMHRSPGRPRWPTGRCGVSSTM